MIKDYKNRIDTPRSTSHHFRPLALLALPLALVASGLYAALEILDPPPKAVTSTPAEKSSLERHTLALPGKPQDTLEVRTNFASEAAQTPKPLPAPEAAPVTREMPAEKPVQLAKIEQKAEAQADLAVEPAKVAPPSKPAPQLNWKAHRIRNGDSLSRIFPKLGLSANLLHRIVTSGQDAKDLANIRPGEELRVALDDEGKLHELILEHSAIKSLKITPAGDSFKAEFLERELEQRSAQISGTVENSLYNSAKKAGLADRMIMDLANLFGWDIDFALEIRAGDSFSVIYEEDYLDGKKYRDGPILAAEFTNKGEVFRAIRYVDETGRADYFTPEGKSVRKAFLRSPVDFRRISSRFQRERWHPVLGKKRPHRGVDYAASTGTPIKASGDGRIRYRARKGGYGKTVILEHGGGITTLYAHLSRYKGKQRKGTRVRQGDIIGYVGSTGLASGPHLHYEFRVNGVHRNPLTVKLPSANPIADKYKQDFLVQAAPLLTRLETLGKTLLADAGN